MDGQFTLAAATLLGTIGGAAIGAISQWEVKKVSNLERLIERYKKDIRARQAEEIEATKWLHEFIPERTELALKRALRERTQQAHGIRPSVGPREVDDNR